MQTSTVTYTPPDSEFGKIFPEYASNFPKGVLSMGLPQIRIPTLIMSHNEDSCQWTPPADAPALAMRLRRARKVEIAIPPAATRPSLTSAMPTRRSYTWGGVWGTYFWIDPTEKLIAVQMIQVAPGKAGPYLAAIRDLTYGALQAPK